MGFVLKSPFSPTGDQPEAIAALSSGITSGVPFQTLLGVTGSGKTFTIAGVIQEVQKPKMCIRDRGKDVDGAASRHELAQPCFESGRPGG